MELVLLVVGAALGWLVAVVRRGPRQHGPTAADLPAPSPVLPDATPTTLPATATPGSEVHGPTSSSAATAAATGPRERAWELARAIEERLEQIDDAANLASEPEFAELTALLREAPFTMRERVHVAASRNVAMSCAALTALATLGEPAHADIARVTGRLGWISLHFALRYLAGSADPAPARALLARLQDWWLEHPQTRASLHTYLEALAAAGLRGFAIDASVLEVDHVEAHADAVQSLDHPLAATYAAELRQGARARAVTREMSRVGHWLEADDGEDLAQTPGFVDLVSTLVEAIDQPGRPSYVALGETGTGKTTAIRAALRRLVRQGWRVLEATAEQVAAGQKYIGELEQRVETMVEMLAAARTLWYAPACHTLLERGTWSGNPHGLLDSLLPALEARRIQLFGESELAAWSALVAQRPRVAGLVRSVRFQAPDADATRELAEAWGERCRAQLGRPVLSPAVVHEALELARQHFPDRAEPGRTLVLLKDALSDARAAEPPTLPLTRDALLAALSRRSGVPVDVLDVERHLDLDAVRRFFAERILGQDEAVECLVDRIAMLKAGLTDSRRPLGVFLFAGPTGTGKTEIAKALAEFLFGSPDRMLRLDMSEYQSEDAAWRLIDAGSGRGTASLPARIREQPFAVVLLDEFEKAHPRVWDLFLQVFDDGRLTDRAGVTASFRHAILILTSNIGSTIDRGGGPGFVSRPGGLSRAAVQRAIDATFRPEFINRLDQVVVFAPLARATMREILRKELRLVLARRGFQVRDWAVEWEPSAIEFLLERGFTLDLGARPLRRAIERHVLAPLARAIVEHRAPSGEQFLFVSSDGAGIEARFVDPDAPPVGGPAAERGHDDPRSIALDPRADDATLRALQQGLDAIQARLDGELVHAARQRAADAMQDAAFWDRPDRAGVLDVAERIDRIEAGARSARSLHGRLARVRGRGAAELVRRLALLVHVLGEAVTSIELAEPEHLQLTVALRERRTLAAGAWADRVQAMYTRWARDRGMRLRGPVRDNDGAAHFDIAGFGAHRILRDEAGLHVWDGDGGDGARQSVLVTVRADLQPFGAPVTDSEQRICRRYAEGLVRDAVRGWRTGRAERVLAGDFDLFETAG